MTADDKPTTRLGLRVNIALYAHYDFLTHLANQESTFGDFVRQAPFSSHLKEKMY